MQSSTVGLYSVTMGQLWFCHLDDYSGRQCPQHLEPPQEAATGGFSEIVMASASLNDGTLV
jgi:hypothetical protein